MRPDFPRFVGVLIAQYTDSLTTLLFGSDVELCKITICAVTDYVYTGRRFHKFGCLEEARNAHPSVRLQETNDFVRDKSSHVFNTASFQDPSDIAEQTYQSAVDNLRLPCGKRDFRSSVLARGGLCCSRDSLSPPAPHASWLRGTAETVAKTFNKLDCTWTVERNLTP